MKLQFSQKIFLIIITIGLVLPWIILFILGIFLNPAKLFSSVPTFNISNCILVSILGAIPFFILAWKIRSIFRSNIQISFLHKTGTIGLIVVTFLVSILLYLSIWIDYFRPGGPLYPTGDGIGLGLGFIYTLIFMPLGYGCGWLVGKLIIWKRKR